MVAGTSGYGRQQKLVTAYSGLQKVQMRFPVQTARRLLWRAERPLSVVCEMDQRIGSALTVER
ncbi:hypothetical protein SPMU_24110 [Sphingomonas mucosissima]|uniref:Uncharacterized protein n=1 Tax=Sphingomonas mucosissima TaxID=370959 RepID=A0A245ZJR1_9SPHN|nr:hypothetical protein SPMU_24110 [Sphingomonas mucosissima]